MNKEQFCEICLGFIAPRLVNALAEQAENKGYFNEATQKSEIIVRQPDKNNYFNDDYYNLAPAERQKTAYIRACHLVESLHDVLDDLRCIPETRKILAHDDYEVFNAVNTAQKYIFSRNCDLQRKED